MKASRLLAILLILQSRGRCSAQALADEFEVSVRTIYRDIDALSAAGVPIYAEAGRNGGIALHEGYRTRLTGLTPAEAAALPLVGLAGAARDLGVSADAANAQLKVLASLPPASGDLAQRMAQRFFLDPIPWYHRPEQLGCLPELASAIWRDKQISIAYESWKGGVTRRLDPLGLAQKGGVWYMIAASRGTPRTYRVSNIQRLETLDAPVQRPKRFDLPRYWADWAEEFEARLLSGRAVVRISDEGQRILRAVMPRAAEFVAQTQRPCRKKGWVEAQMPIEAPDYSARQVLRLGSEIEVLSPDALRAAIRREAQAVVDAYSSARGQSTRRARTRRA